MTSKIKVNTVTTESGCTVTLGESGKNVVVANNDIRSNTYKAADGGVIASQCGATITLGASGDTITLASGASQTGFGRTGTVNWQTSSIKTATFTAANGEGYFANTSGGAFTMNLPAGTAGNIVSVVDYTNSFQTHNLTISPNGSQKIGGNAANATLSTEGQSVTFVYVDDTEGWKNIQDSTSNVVGTVPFVVATGGTETTSGNCKIHTFTGPGTFTVTAASTTASNNQAGYFVLAGGGSGGGGQTSGGGGAGGFREGKCGPVTPYTASPVSTSGHTLTAQAYPITVGAGGAGAPGNGGAGSNSIFSTITSAGGGLGVSSGPKGGDGGSGGGGGRNAPGLKGDGNTPPVSPSQGNPGGPSSQLTNPGANPNTGGGGGGIDGPGGTGTQPAAGNGAAGLATSITGTPVVRGAGGGGGGEAAPTGSGGSGGGGNGAGGCGATGGNATANTGSGGGGVGWGPSSGGGAGGSGGSGLVVIRYKYQQVNYE